MRSWELGNFSCSSRPRPQACTRPPHHHSLVTSFIDHFLNTLLRCTEYLNVLVDVGGFFKTSNYLSNLPPSAPFWINWLVWLYKTNISAASEFCCMAWQATHATHIHIEDPKPSRSSRPTTHLFIPTPSLLQPCYVCDFCPCHRPRGYKHVGLWRG